LLYLFLNNPVTYEPKGDCIPFNPKVNTLS
jgi:hypothetical protein